MRSATVSFALATTLLSPILGQLTDHTTVAVGDQVWYVRASIPLYRSLINIFVVCSFEGFVMDNFCIERGTLLDEPSTTTLVNPERHSVHWYEARSS